jgi:hypothetical protein
VGNQPNTQYNTWFSQREGDPWAVLLKGGDDYIKARTAAIQATDPDFVALVCEMMRHERRERPSAGELLARPDIRARFTLRQTITDQMTTVSSIISFLLVFIFFIIFFHPLFF